MRPLLLLLVLAACKDHVNEAAERDELADEILTTAQAFGKAMCSCPDTACAQKTSERYASWTEKAQTDIAALEGKQGESVTASKKAIERAFAAYEECAIRFAIGRPPK